MNKESLKTWGLTALAVLGVATLVFVLLVTVFAPKQESAPVGGISYTGSDYYQPTEYFTGCSRWTWLTSCYGSGSQSLLDGDVSFIAANNQGHFQRLWVMLDQLMTWDSTNGYTGFNQAYLSNLDDAIARFHARGISLDLVLYEASSGSSDKNQFHPEALDGSHPQMRANYLLALKDFVNHLAANSTDQASVAVMDLFNEAYFQLERFGLSDSTIHQWLQDEYNTVHLAQPGFNYTVSDTTRLLKDYSTWKTMYPVDIYDVHVYDNAPWNDPGLYQAAKSFTKPWFSGEAGCAPGNVSCTYGGNTQCSQPSTCALSVDSWFLNNLSGDGSIAVLIEDRGTVWGYPGGQNSRGLTLVGKLVQQQQQPVTSVVNTPVAPTAVPQPTTIPPTAAPPVVVVAPVGYFGTIPVGGALPTEAQCTAAVRPAAGEVRTDNNTANHTVPSSAQEQTIQSASWSGVGYGAADPELHRVTGNFTGTTDQIIQWAACKWGLDENVVRAQMTNESHWHQNDRGDYTTNQAWCPPGTIDSTGGCYQSYGITQIKWHWNPWVWPMNRDMTAFTADYTYATWRSCYEGKIGYLQTNGSGYKPGDLWGCIGFWYSGQWHDSGATSYISQVQGYLQTTPWLSWPGWTSLPPTMPGASTPVVAPTSVPNTQVPSAVPTAIPVVPQATATTTTVRPCPTTPSRSGELEPDGDSDDGPYLTATAQAKLGCH